MTNMSEYDFYLKQKMSVIFYAKDVSPWKRSTTITAVQHGGKVKLNQTNDD